MTHQTDKSHCCNAPFVRFVSGGGDQVTGAYVKCADCKKDYQVDYKTGLLVEINKIDS